MWNRIVAASLLIFAGGVNALTFVVDDDGVECPAPDFNTIAAALAAAGDGDVVDVCDGTYSEGQLTVSNIVTIDGRNRDATIINSTGTYGFRVESPGVTISDLVIEDGGGTHGIGFVQTGPVLANNSISNVVIRNFSGGRGVEIAGAAMDDLSIADSFFDNNTIGVRMSSTTVIDGLMVTGSTFSAPVNDNAFTGIGIYQANDGSTSTLRDLQVSGNTFTNLSLGGLFLEEVRESTIMSNQFTGNYTGIIINKVNSTSGVDISDVLIDDNMFDDHTGRAIFLGHAAVAQGLGPNVQISNNVINMDAASVTGSRGAITTNLPSANVHAQLSIVGNSISFSGMFPATRTAWGIHLSGDGPVLIDRNNLSGGNLAPGSSPPFAGIYIESDNATRGARQDAVTISCNGLNDFTDAITVFDSVNMQAGNLPAAVNVLVDQNDIVGNNAFGINNAGTSETIDADSNYWGDPSGPGGAGPGMGDAITANVSAATPLFGVQANCTTPVDLMEFDID